MSSFQDIQPEPRKIFLFHLINDDQRIGFLLCTSQYGACKKLMWDVGTRIYNLVPESKIKKLYEILDRWMSGEPESIRALQEARKELSKILADHFYSEMHLGIIPTVTLPGTKETPTSEPRSDKKSSRLE